MLSGSSLLLRSASDGSTKWRHHSSALLTHLAISGKNSVLAAGVMPNASATPMLEEVSLLDGSLARSSHGSTACASKPQFVSHPEKGTRLMCVSAHDSSMLLDMDIDFSKESQLPLPKDVGAAVSICGLRSSGTGQPLELLWIHSSRNPSLLSTSMSSKANQAPQVVHSCAETSDCILSSEADDKEAGTAVAVIEANRNATSPDQKKVVVFDRQGRRVQSEQIDGLHAETSGNLMRAFLGTYIQSDGGSVGYRLLAVTDGGTVALMQQGKIQWTRFEALARIKASLFCDLPRRSQYQQRSGRGSSAALALSNALGGLAQSTRELVYTLRDNIQAVVAQRSNGVPDLGKPTVATMAGVEKDEWEYDVYGFRKLIVILTRTNMLAAINTQSGAIAWTRCVREGRGVSIRRFAPPRNATSGERLLLLAKHESASGDSDSGNTIALVFDSSNGHLLQSECISHSDGSLKHVVELPPSHTTMSSSRSPSHAHKSFLLVDSNGYASLFQQNASSFASPSGPQTDSDVYYYTVDAAHNAIEGRVLRHEVDGAPYNSSLSWRLQMRKDKDGRIAAHTSKRRSDALRSAVRVTGDRAMLYRYTNPNIVFVATSTNTIQSGGENDVDFVESRLIDAAAGRILYRARHTNARAPVQAALADNWVVYQYWDSRAKRPTISVLEMYDEGERKRQERRVVQAAFKAARGLGVGEPGRMASSRDLSQLKVLGQSYFFPQSMRAMGVSQSLRGITPRQVLVALASDQIVALDKKLLDPRRPTNKPSQSEKDEGLVQYAEHLPLSGRAFLAEGERVRRVSAIETGTTHVESTCLVLAYGLDVLMDKIAPGKAYDLLGDDFSYALLALTLAALVGVTIGLILASRHRERERRWQ